MSTVAPRGLSCSHSSRAPSSRLSKKALRVLAYQAAKAGGNLPEPKKRVEDGIKTTIPEWMVEANRPGIAQIIDTAKQLRTPKKASMTKAHTAPSGATYSYIRRVGGSR